MTSPDLLNLHCSARVAALSDDEQAALLPQLAGWALADGKLVKTYKLADYHATIDFVNALAAMIHLEDHHPELLVSYAQCAVSFNTHSVNGGRGGISINDFICAAKSDAIFAQRAGA